MDSVNEEDREKKESERKKGGQEQEKEGMRRIKGCKG